MLQLICTNEEKIPVLAAPVTSAGNPAPIDGALSVLVLSGEGTVEMTGDLSFFLVSPATSGVTQYLVEADVDTGEGVVTISEMITLTVEGAKAASFGLVAGAAVPK